MSDSLKPPLKERVLDDVDATAQTELPHRVRLVGLDGFYAERELPGDLLVAVTRRDQLQHTRLSVRQLDTGFGRLVGASQQPRGHSRGQRRVDVLSSCRCSSDRLDQFVWGTLFQNISG